MNIIELIDNAKDEHLEMSRFNCHIKGLHSIVVNNDNERLTRIFFTDRDHEMDNSDIVTFENNLGIHSHRYAITLEGIVGRAFNFTFEIVDKGRGESCNHYVYKDRENIKHIGRVFMQLKGVNTIQKEQPIIMFPDELHTVFVPKGVQAAWLVSEGVECSDSTDLYTNKRPKCIEHYTKSAQEVRDWVKKWLDNV